MKAKDSDSDADADTAVESRERTKEQEQEQEQEEVAGRRRPGVGGLALDSNEETALTPTPWPVMRWHTCRMTRTIRNKKDIQRRPIDISTKK